MAISECQILFYWLSKVIDLWGPYVGGGTYIQEGTQFKTENIWPQMNITVQNHPSVKKENE